MRFSVGAVARFAGISVRTLHHYDHVGLLVPTARSPAGYREYTTADLERLQRILCYRELGFGLDKIAAILDDPDVDPVDHLRRQHAALTGQVERLQAMIHAIEKTLEARKMGINLTPDELFEVFGDVDPTEHAEEAEQRWGDTDAWRESQRRTASYDKHDWLAVKAEAQDLNQRFVAAMRAGDAATSQTAMDIAEAHRRHISRWFYDCPVQMHRHLAELYVSDQRFTAHYDEQAPGLARYVHAAITANADRHTTDG
jgi:MerR family transcriptional regulator, thiopeptide resistance regulator